VAAIPSIFFRAATTGSTLTVTKPTGAIEGDVVFIFWFTDAGGLTPPAGWTQIGTTFNGSGTNRYHTYWRAIGDAEPASWVWTGTALQNYVCVAYVGVSTSLPYGNFLNEYISGSGTTPSVGPIDIAAGERAIAMVQPEGTPSFTPEAGWTERADSVGNHAAERDALTAATGETYDPTASGSDNYGCAILALRPNVTARRLYFDSTTAPAVSPSFDSSWDDSEDADRRVLRDAKGSSALTDKTGDEASATGNLDVLVRQYLIPTGAGYLTGAVKCQVRCLESSSSANMRAQCIIRSLNPDLSVIGIACAGNASTGTSSPTNELPTTTPANRRFPRLADSRHLTTTPTVEGGYLCVEIGVRAHQTSTTDFIATLRFGETATDFPEDDSTTADNCPWIEFTDGVVLAGESPSLMPGPYMRRAA